MSCLIDAMCQGLVIGLHMVSLHSSGTYVTETNIVGPAVTREYETFTPGIYLRAASGLTLGTYHNSYGKPSVYAGWTVETDDERFALTVGSVTGYRHIVKENRVPYLGQPPAVHVKGHALQPLLVPSVRFGLGTEAALRVSYVPEPRKGGASVVHLSIEAKF